MRHICGGQVDGHTLAQIMQKWRLATEVDASTPTFLNGSVGTQLKDAIWHDVSSEHILFYWGRPWPCHFLLKFPAFVVPPWLALAIR